MCTCFPLCIAARRRLHRRPPLFTYAHAHMLAQGCVERWAYCFRGLSSSVAEVDYICKLTHFLSTALPVQLRHTLSCTAVQLSRSGGPCWTVLLVARHSETVEGRTSEWQKRRSTRQLPSCRDCLPFLLLCNHCPVKCRLCERLRRVRARRDN